MAKRLRKSRFIRGNMNPLTLQHAIENKFTAIDCVRYFQPDWSDEECDYFLWSHTCFPFSTQIMIEQLNQYFLK